MKHLRLKFKTEIATQYIEFGDNTKKNCTWIGFILLD